MVSALNVVIVDREWITCRELRLKLPLETGINVVAEACTVRDAIGQIASQAPDIVLVADQRDGLRGIALLAALRRKRPNTRCVVVSELDDVETRVECVEAGADALVSRSASPQELQDTLWDVAAGKNVLQSQAIGDLAMMQRLLHQVRRSPAGRCPMNRFDPNLSPCLLGVLDGVVQGWSNRQISAAEGIAEQTVKHHIANLKQRLGVRDRIGLVRHAVLQEWARMEPVATGAPAEPSDETENTSLSSLTVIAQGPQARHFQDHGLAASASA